MQKMIHPVTLQVIYHRLVSIADEMETALLKASMSIIVKEGRDCTTAIFDAQGRIAAQAVVMAIHLGSLVGIVPQILKFFPVSEMQEGDVYLSNDPYAGGTHLPDVAVVVPVIYQGQVVALSCSMVHHQDMGAMLPGVPTHATSIYQEGLNLPPLKFYDAGKPVKVVHDIIRKNVRTSDLVIGDLRAQVSAGNVGKVRILELFEEYGKNMVLAAMKEIMDYAEALTRRELEKVPDGSYSFADYLDNDGVDIDQRIKIQVTVTIRGSEFIVDFSGSAPQVRGPLNCTPSTTWGSVIYAIRALTGASIPTNDGCFRPITLILPEESIVNPRWPAALGVRAVTATKTVEVIMGALLQATPERMTACSGGTTTAIYFGGTDPLTGEEYVSCELAQNGLGARPNKDGIDVICTDIIIGNNIPCEAIETNAPLRVVKIGLHEGSGGAGEYRGGLGEEEIIELVRGNDISASFRGERNYSRPWGVFGGLPGASQRNFVVRRTGEKEEIPSKRDLILNQGDQVHFCTPGGGGYGDPLKRKPEFVLEDVLNQRVSLQAAAEDYGVIISKESMTIDFEKTTEAREERRRLRGPITWIYDRGPQLDDNIPSGRSM